jgi:hypothetical protein
MKLVKVTWQDTFAETGWSGGDNDLDTVKVESD